MRNDFQNARMTFPNMPEEVFTLWLDGRILANGWPPKGIEWAGFLLGKSVSEWQQINWTKRKVSISWEALGVLSQQNVNMLIDGNVNERSNLMTAYIPDTKERFRSITKYALEHQNVPGTLVLLKSGTKYEVIEGNHRVAVLIALQNFKDTKEKIMSPQTAWVGEHDSSQQ